MKSKQRCTQRLKLCIALMCLCGVCQAFKLDLDNEAAGRKGGPASVKGGGYPGQQDDYNNNNNLLDNIMNQVVNGHVSHDHIVHWMAQIEAALKEGSITDTQFRLFVHDLHVKAPEQHYSDWCCPFG